ncbi:MAG: hypothetical protein AAGF12_06555 [Myxococcota bacterium]
MIRWLVLFGWVTFGCGASQTAAPPPPEGPVHPLISEWLEVTENPGRGVGQQFSTYVRDALRDPAAARVPVSGTAGGDEEELRLLEIDHGVRSFLPLVLSATADPELDELRETLRALDRIEAAADVEAAEALLRERFEALDRGVDIARAHRQVHGRDESRPPSRRELGLVALELTIERLRSGLQHGFAQPDPAGGAAGFPPHYEWPWTALPYLALSAGAPPLRVHYAFRSMLGELARCAWGQPLE